MCFWLSTRTMKDGMSTTCLPTLDSKHRATRGQARTGQGGSRGPGMGQGGNRGPGTSDQGGRSGCH